MNSFVRNFFQPKQTTYSLEISASEIKDHIFKVPENPVFSILIPSWNNLSYLKLCIDSILKNSKYQHQILVHLNDGQDGSREYLNEMKITHSTSPDNIGICWSLNHLRSHVQCDYILYINDDMYLCPHWDEKLLRKAKSFKDDMFYLSSTMIEPRDTGNACVVGGKNYGDSVETFKESALLADCDQLIRQDWLGSTWPPSLVSTRLWDLVGGYSVEFSPGFYSDPDFSKKLWNVGVREFIGVGNSLAYHFMSKSTSKIKANDGRMGFIKKWDMKASYFCDKILKRGQTLE